MKTCKIEKSFDKGFEVKAVNKEKEVERKLSADETLCKENAEKEYKKEGKTQSTFKRKHE